MFRGFVTTILAVVLILPGVLLADTVKGRIQFMSFKAKSIQIGVKDKPSVVVGFDKNTQFVNAKGPKELGTKDLIEVEYSPGAPASRYGFDPESQGESGREHRRRTGHEHVL